MRTTIFIAGLFPFFMVISLGLVYGQDPDYAALQFEYNCEKLPQLYLKTAKQSEIQKFDGLTGYFEGFFDDFCLSEKSPKIKAKTKHSPKTKEVDYTALTLSQIETAARVVPDNRWNWVRKYLTYKYIETGNKVDRNHPMVRQFMNHYRIRPIGKLTEVEKLISQAFVRTGKADSAIMMQAFILNQSFQSNHLNEVYHQTVNDIYFRFVLFGEYDNILWQATLRYYAPLCPAEYGPIVYRARVLLASVGDTVIYEDLENCQTPPSVPPAINKEVVYGQDEEQEWVWVFPNPAANQIQIESYLLTREAVLELFDSHGRMVAHKVLNQDHSITRMDLRDLLPGIYHYRIRGARNLAKPNGKLVITR